MKNVLVKNVVGKFSFYKKKEIKFDNSMIVELKEKPNDVNEREKTNEILDTSQNGGPSAACEGVRVSYVFYLTPAAQGPHPRDPFSKVSGHFEENQSALVFAFPSNKFFLVNEYYCCYYYYSI